MLSAIPKIAGWPFSKVTDRVEKVGELVGNWASLVGFTPGLNANDNMLVIPDTPFTILDSQLNKLPVGAYDSVPYPAPSVLGNSYVSIASVGNKAWLSQNKGKTWALQSDGTYSIGNIFRFKSKMFFSNSGSMFTLRDLAQNFDSSSVTVQSVQPSTTGFPQIIAFGAKNANCIVTSGNNTVTASTMFVCWNFPTFNAYNTGAQQAQQYYYLGNNIFYTSKDATTRFFYVPPTAGVPTLLQTKTNTLFARVHHLRNQVFFVKSNGEVCVAPLAATVENPAISMNDAATYLVKVFAAVEGINTSQLLPAGSAQYVFPWGFDRFVVMARRGSPLIATTHIWEVKTAKPSVKFTFKAGKTGTSATGSTGFGTYNGNYGYGTEHGQMIAPGEVEVLICSDWRQPSLAPPYGGFGLLLNMTQTEVKTRFVAVKANGRTFSIDSLETTELRAFPFPIVTGGTGQGTLCNWTLDLAEFVDGQTYTVELIPR